MLKKSRKLSRSLTPEPAGVDLDSDTRPEHSSGLPVSSSRSYADDNGRPYASNTCDLYFQSQGPLHIPRDLLRKSPKLSSHSGWTCGRLRTLRLDDVSLDTGHVLVNFLVTGNYECLKPQGESLTEKNASEFTTALRVYTAAEFFELESLCDLAEKEMQRLGDELSLPSMIDIIEEMGSKSLQTLRAAIECRMQSFLRSLTRAAADMVLSELGTPNTISKLILKSVVELQLNSIELSCEKEVLEEPMLEEPAPAEDVLPEQYPDEPAPSAEAYEEVAPEQYPEEPTPAEAYEEVPPEQYTEEPAPAEAYEVEPQSGDAVGVTGVDQFAADQSFVMPKPDEAGPDDSWDLPPATSKKDKIKGKKEKKGKKKAKGAETSEFVEISRPPPDYAEPAPVFPSPAKPPIGDGTYSYFSSPLSEGLTSDRVRNAFSGFYSSSDAQDSEVRCGRRLEHLRPNGDWKTCSSCRKLVHQFSRELGED